MLVLYLVLACSWMHVRRASGALGTARAAYRRHADIEACVQHLVASGITPDISILTELYNEQEMQLAMVAVKKVQDEREASIKEKARKKVDILSYNGWGFEKPQTGTYQGGAKVGQPRYGPAVEHGKFRWVGTRCGALYHVACVNEYL